MIGISDVKPVLNVPYLNIFEFKGDLKTMAKGRLSMKNNNAHKDIVCLETQCTSLKDFL